MKNNFACIGTAPLLWKSMFFLIPLLAVVFAVLVVSIIIHLRLNKKKRKALLDSTLKIRIIWFLVVLLSLLTYGIIGLDFNFYLLVLLVISLLVLAAFYTGEKLRLFRVHYSRWIVFIILAVVFAAFFLICSIKTIRENRQNVLSEDGKQTSCINRSIF